MRPAVPFLVIVLLTVGLGACESSQTRSARLQKTGRNRARLTTITAGAANAAVKVTGSAVLHAAGGNAVVVALRNTGTVAQVRVPVVVTVKDAKGRVVYRNDIRGLQPALQQLAYLGGGQKVYWVDDQVLAPTPPRSVAVTVGRAQGTAPARTPTVVADPPRLLRDSTGAYATGQIRNESARSQINLPIFCVALRGGRVVAAGRAIIPKLDPAPTRKPVSYRIFFIGNPQGARLQLAVAPTVL